MWSPQVARSVNVAVLQQRADATALADLVSLGVRVEPVDGIGLVEGVAGTYSTSRTDGGSATDSVASLVVALLSGSSEEATLSEASALVPMGVGTEVLLLTEGGVSLSTVLADDDGLFLIERGVRTVILTGPQRDTVFVRREHMSLIPRESTYEKSGRFRWPQPAR